MAKKKRKNPGGAWRARGFRAGVGGRYGEDADRAWRAAPKKPPMRVKGGFGAPAVSGRYVEAHEYFLEGFYKGVRAREERARKNPAGLRSVKGSTGWIKATAVRFVKRGRRTEVFVKQGPRKRATKRARKGSTKTSRRQRRR